jgi:4'-phosphopantetheinyl transferase
VIRAHVRWVVDTGDHDLSPLAAALAPAEQADFAVLRLPARQRGFLLTRALLRATLPEVTGVSPAATAYARAGSGRLCLVDPAGWHVSISHANGLAAVAVANAPCGVDIEGPRTTDTTAVARRYFAAPERDWLASLPEEARHTAFLQLWTLKEAAVKALGTGLAGHLDRLCFQVDGDTVRPAFATPPLATWQAAAGAAQVAAAVATADTVAWSLREASLARLLAG